MRVAKRLQRVIHLYFIALLLSVVCCPCLLQAQQVTITGKIIDAQDKTPIAGAGVQVKGSSNGVVTDQEGAFHISAPSNAILIISYVGYRTTEVRAGAETATIGLQRDTRALSEVVVTALGITRPAKSLGYAVQTVTNKELTNAPDPNLVNNLSGKIAGVTITNGGAGVGSTSRIVVRGENSFSGSNQPLFVVDGVPINNETYFNNAIENSSNQGTWAEVDWGNGAAEINPNDIQKITVLKGATAAALYGSRAANGAIVLTTKKGAGKGMGISFNSNTTFETPLKLPRLQNQYGAGVNAYPLSGAPNTYAFVNGGGSNENNIPNWGLKFDPNVKVNQFDSPAGDGLQAGDLTPGSVDPNYKIVPTPWVGHADHFKKFLQTGFTTQNSLSVGGVTDNGSYNMSMGYLSNTGILPGTNLKRYSLSLRGEHRFSHHLTSDVFLNYINSYSGNRPNIGYGSESVMYTFFGVYGMPMNIDLNSLKKQWQVGQDQLHQFRYWNNHDNPYVTLFDNTNSFKKNRLLGNASLKYEFTPHLNLMVRTGTDYYTDNREGHRAFTTVRFPSGGFRTDNVTYFENNTDLLLNFHNQVSPLFNINISGGGNKFTQNITYTRDIANALITPGLYNFSNAQNQLPTLYQKFDKEIYSLYAFGDIDYKKILYLNITARNDWSSTLPKGHNSYFYPSASLSGIISDMVTLPDAFSFLKLRVSAAQVGRDADPYSVNNTYLTNTPFNNNPLTTANPVLANNNLKPSTTTTEEAGAEIRFLRDRFGLDVTVYNSETKDEIVQLPIPVSSGYTNAYVNGATINNKGIEVMVTAAAIRPKAPGGFSWDMNVNFSHNVSKVKALPAGLPTYVYAQVTQYDRYYRAIQYNAMAGGKIGNMYGNDFQRDPNGNIIYVNGIPQITTDQHHLLGNYNPDFIVGWYNEFTWKDFNLSFTWDWHQGGRYYSYTSLGILAGGMSVETLPGRETGIVGKGVKLDAASGKYVPNDVKVDAATYYNGYYNATNNEAFMYDETYVKLREVRLGYTFRHFLGRSSPAGLNISLIGRNLLEFTQNKDVDPETLALRGQQILPGTEFLSIPATRSMGISIGVNF
ncbi:MAG: SusC/RagA family TonB-linked outer membrane protein [Chitinophagaceae bacterium]|nr:SusC/RagA family TonB-linked outer membrane protein [Chitinophagaceae bacterium]